MQPHFPHLYRNGLLATKGEHRWILIWNQRRCKIHKLMCGHLSRGPTTMVSFAYCSSHLLKKRPNFILYSKNQGITHYLARGAKHWYYIKMNGLNLLPDGQNRYLYFPVLFRSHLPTYKITLLGQLHSGIPKNYILLFVK